MNDIADILDAAADLIQFAGHWQGGLMSEQPGYCAHTAHAHVDEQLHIEASLTLSRFIGLTPVDELQPLFDWNDTTSTDEVIDTMRRCAKALREVES